MWIWFAMPLVVGLVAALIAVLRHDGIESIYIGIVESDLAMRSDRGGLHVRAYVDETLVHEPREAPQRACEGEVACDAGV
jgi:hypothetical protein